MHQGKMPSMIKNLEIKSHQQFFIFKDQLYFSHDGNYIFFLTVSYDGFIDKMIVINAEDLT